MWIPVPGNEFGRYRVVGRHSFYAAGFVLPAREEPSGAARELWLLTPTGTENPDLRAEIVRTATAVRKIRSEHLATLHEFGQVDGQPFFARAALEGVPMRAAGALLSDIPSALEAVARIAQGVQSLHDAGLVDGALGPGRVIVSGGPGHIRARLRDASLLGVLLKHGAVVGPVWEETLDYRAPEVHAGQPADSRSDVYSLGGVLWTALTGRPPFATYVGHQLDPVPQLAGDVPDVLALNAVLARALAKDPADRYRRALDLVDALRMVPGVSGFHVEIDPPAHRPDARAEAALVAPVEQVAAVEHVATVEPVAAVEAADAVPAPADVLPAIDEDVDDGWARSGDHRPLEVLRASLPDDLGGAPARSRGRSGSSARLLGFVLLVGLLALAAVLAVRHLDLVTFPGPADGTASTTVVGPQTDGVRAIA